ncbi:hypothetical protein C0J52_21797, partial [Blattella germanica]
KVSRGGITREKGKNSSTTRGGELGYSLGIYQLRAKVTFYFQRSFGTNPNATRLSICSWHTDRVCQFVPDILRKAGW